MVASEPVVVESKPVMVAVGRALVVVVVVHVFLLLPLVVVENDVF